MLVSVRLGVDVAGVAKDGGARPVGVDERPVELIRSPYMNIKSSMNT